MIEFYSFEDLDNKKINETATIVSEYSRGQQRELAPLSHEEIHLTDMAFAAFSRDVFAGFVRAKPAKIHENSQASYQEVGSLIVAPPFRGQGIARQLIGLVTDSVIQERNIPCSLANPNSQAVFHALGYEMALPGELPKSIKSHFGNNELIYPTCKIVDMR